MSDDFASALDRLGPSAPTNPDAFPVLAPDWQEPKRQEVLAPSVDAGDRGDRLEKLIDLSLAKAEEIMNLPIDQCDDGYVKVAALQKDLVVSILNTGIKVDENRFRKRSTEMLGAILEQIKAQETALGVVPIVLAQSQA